jgi:hypothetical protein
MKSCGGFLGEVKRNGQVEGLSLFPPFRKCEEFMEPVENRPWDTWHVIDDGKRFIINYVSDGFYNYLKHLLHSRMCRGLVGLNFPIVLVWFSRLKKKARQHFIQHVFTNPKG